MELDFADGELRAIFITHVLHHIPFPAKFLAEANRCLARNDRVVMVEPSNGFFQRFLTKVLDHCEYYDDQVEKWENSNDQRIADANMALPWVIFERDRAIMEKNFPSLKITKIRYHTFLSYVISGGLTYRAFLPTFCLPLIKGFEWLLKSLMPYLGTMMTIELEKI